MELKNNEQCHHVIQNPFSRCFLPPLINVKRSEQIDKALSNSIKNDPITFDAITFLKENSKHNIIERHITKLIDERERVEKESSKNTKKQ